MTPEQKGILEGMFDDFDYAADEIHQECLNEIPQIQAAREAVHEARNALESLLYPG
jgi:hypothetical protein